MTNTTNRNLLFILNFIHKDLSILRLLELGLEYSQISKITETIIEEELATLDEDGKISLTDKGIDLLDQLFNKSYPDLNKDWILPSEYYRIDSIDPTDIYLPQKKDVIKLKE